MLVRSLLQQSRVVPRSGALHTSAVLGKLPKNGNRPVHESRTSTANSSDQIQHPGYTSADTPVTDAHPSQMPGADPDLKPLR